MANRFQAFLFRTRGIYLFVSLIGSMALKGYLGGTTPRLFFVVGIFWVSLVQAFRVYAAAYLWGRQAVTTVGADFLCTNGPYAHLRNPFYLGNFLIGIGICLMINVWYAYVLFGASYAFVYSVVIPYEEQFLEEKFGKAYADYKAATPRLIPRLTAYRGGGNVIPDYRAGILGELHVPIFLIIVISIAYALFAR
ncbi:MAG: isoprenylcysteine carboxylmethyltransferase family protein [Chloroflexi bacterium]|nr:isoprenylcysteine carboxylmethyltransferase family protein [Chloroflexota bacterium]MBI3762735.1 isoprenylcysteine carboxylmethyltransferase family protein [Chloroflexota bacterium]